MTEEQFEQPDSFGIKELKDIFINDKSDIIRLIILIENQPKEERDVKMEHIKIALSELGMEFPSDEYIQLVKNKSDN